MDLDIHADCRLLLRFALLASPFVTLTVVLPFLARFHHLLLRTGQSLPGRLTGCLRLFLRTHTALYRLPPTWPCCKLQTGSAAAPLANRPGDDLAATPLLTGTHGARRVIPPAPLLRPTTTCGRATDTDDLYMRRCGRAVAFPLPLFCGATAGQSDATTCDAPVTDY